jgi:transketolase
MMTDFSRSRRIAAELRAQLVQMSHQAGAPHLGSCLSCVDILVAAYWHCLRINPDRADDPGRDRFLLSKGHAAPALYAVLGKRGFFPEALLETFGKDGGVLAEQPFPRCVPGVEAATGSLGHGLNLGLGMALAGRIQKRPFRVVVLLSDGELNEGTVWEAAMFAAAQKVDNLTAIVDYNKWQATDRSREVMALEPLQAKWAAFGWNAVETDGHDLPGLVKQLQIADCRLQIEDCQTQACNQESALDNLQSAICNLQSSEGRPTAIIAHTVKGKGISFMEDDNNWHYRIPTAQEVQAAWQELAQGILTREIGAEGVAA